MNPNHPSYLDEMIPIGHWGKIRDTPSKHQSQRGEHNHHIQEKHTVTSTARTIGFSVKFDSPLSWNTYNDELFPLRNVLKAFEIVRLNLGIVGIVGFLLEHGELSG